MKQNVIEANRDRDLYLTDERNVYFVPKGWCDDWSIASGMGGGWQKLIKLTTPTN